MASLTLWTAKTWMVLALVAAAGVALLTPDAGAAIVDFIRGGGGTALFTP